MCEMCKYKDYCIPDECKELNNKSIYEIKLFSIIEDVVITVNDGKISGFINKDYDEYLTSVLDPRD